jgi:hypothetical protein
MDESKVPMMVASTLLSQQRLLLQFDSSSYLFFPALFDYEVVLVSCVLLNLEHQKRFRLRRAFPLASIVSSVAAFKRKKGRLRLCFHGLPPILCENMFSQRLPPIRYLGHPSTRGVQNEVTVEWKPTSGKLDVYASCATRL